MTTKKEPAEYVKAVIGVFQILMASVIVWLFSTTMEMKGQIIELKSNQQHIQSALPKVVEAVEKNTDVIRNLEKTTQRVVTLLESLSR
jgi:hypothetical protein